MRSMLQQVANNNSSSSQIISKQYSSLFLLGYYVQPIDTESCTVTSITNFSPDLKALETDIISCRKLKQHIEDLAQITDVTDKKDKSIDKIKNLASYLYKAGASKANEILDRRQQQLLNEPASSSAVSSMGSVIASFNPISDQSVNADDVLTVEALKGPMQNIDRNIPARQILRVPIDYNPADHNTLHVDFICRSDQSPYFGIFFMPTDPNSDIINLPKASGELLTIIPLTSIQATNKPFNLTLNFGYLPTGQISIVFDNQSLQSKNIPKSITYKAYCEKIPHAEFSLSITIPRKQVYKLPIILQVSNSISISYKCQIEILFSIIYEPRDKSLKRIIVCPPTKLCNLLNSKYETLDTIGWDGVLFLVWDNSSSILASRNLSFDVRIKSSQ